MQLWWVEISWARVVYRILQSVGRRNQWQSVDRNSIPTGKAVLHIYLWQEASELK